MFIYVFCQSSAMKLNKFLIFLILLIAVIFAIGCVSQQPQTKAPETPAQNAEKVSSNQPNQQTNAPETQAEKITPEIKQTVRDDFGCWPPSCSYIPDSSGRQNCEDWKAGKPVQWPTDCNYFSGQPPCQKLCEFETSSAPVEQQKQKEVVVQKPCNLGPLQRQFSNTPYYIGTLIDDHFHMPQMRKIPNVPTAPVLDQDISGHDVACLFSNKDRIKSVIAFYGIPFDLKDSSVKTIREIEQQYPGVINHFLELVSFPGYPLDPTQVGKVLDANEGLFKGYGEISLYLDFYRITKPNDPQFRELYKIAEKHHLIVMVHPIEEQMQAIEEVVHDYPNVQFLFHGAESLPSANMFYDTFLGKYANAHYSVDTTLFGESSYGGPLLDAFTNKQDFATKFKENWQDTLNKKVAFWKNKIEKHPDQFLWGTDRGHALWHYDPEVESLLEEYSRAFIGQLDPAVQEKYAYKNAESLLQKR